MEKPFASFKNHEVTPEQGEIAYEAIQAIIKRGSIFKDEYPTPEQKKTYRQIVTRFNCMARLDLHDEWEAFLHKINEEKEMKRQSKRYDYITKLRATESIKEAGDGMREPVVESYQIISDPFDGSMMSIMIVGKEFMNHKTKRMGYADSQEIRKHKDPLLRERAKGLNAKSTI